MSKSEPEASEASAAQISGPRLSETGQIYVTMAAADQYAAARDLRHEEARRELTVLLMRATRHGQTASGAESWRARSKTLNADVQAHIVSQEGLAVVVHVHVRSCRAPRAGGK